MRKVVRIEPKQHRHFVDVDGKVERVDWTQPGKDRGERVVQYAQAQRRRHLEAVMATQVLKERAKVRGL